MVNTGCAETHRPDSCLAFLRNLALVSAGAGRPELTAVTTLVLIGMRRNVLGTWASGARTGIAIALLRRRSSTLFLLSFGCHNISDLDPVH
jgi:hypothetical protein